tara:strand:- start:68 stop:1696 length:1629 start_codon:yes stop_codon:yes gene_type:complete
MGTYDKDMIVCAMQKHHTPSLCLIKGGEVVWYQEERKISKIKKIIGIPFRCIDLLFSGNPIKVNKFILTGYNYSDAEVSQIEQYLYYKNLLPWGEKVFEPYAAHHLAHVFKAYIDSGFKKARVFVVDGRGSAWYLSDQTETCETSSVYDVDQTGVRCIYKKVWCREIKPKNITVNINYNPSLNTPWIAPGSQDTILGIDKNIKFEITHKFDLGYFYANISKHFNFDDEEGKFMGYQSYGKFDSKIYKTLEKGVNKEELKKLPLNKDVAHTSQIYFEREYAKLVKRFECENMVFTGGTALNVINNYKLVRKFKNSNLWFDPLCEDVGNSIGMAYAYLYYKKQQIKPLKNIYISSTPACKISLKKIKPVKLSDVVQLLKKGNVVGLFQGKSEAGPRALGNRSLLLDPTLPNGKDIMNKIKNRERFRPFACSILEERAEEWFEMEGIKKSPYMMYAFQAKQIARERAPAIVHVDNTCRVQTVTKDENKVLYKILKMFKVPLLMNTSMNLAGDPLNETLEDALLTMKKSSLKYIYLPEHNKLIKNE